MIVRSAVLEGRFEGGDAVAIDRHLTTTVRDVLLRYPGIRKVVIRKPIEVEDGAPPVCVVFDLYYASHADMQAAMASPVRQEVRAAMATVMPHFKGRLYHLIHEEAVVVEPSR